MSQSLSSVKIHVVFSTKHRAPLLTPDLQRDCYAYLAIVARNHKARVYEVGGMPDHVHMLLALPRTITLAKLMEILKTSSSKWLKAKGPFAWQDGYGAFSVSESNVDSVRRYIRDQELHHKRASFQHEYLRILSKSNVPFDERFLWD
jgi:REP element-mobilizing transposase RayT